MKVATHSRTKLQPCYLAEDPPAVPAGQPPVTEDKTPQGNPPAPGGQNGAPPPSGGPNDGTGNPNPQGNPPEDAPSTITKAEAEAEKQRAVTAALADHKRREAEKAKRSANQTARQAAEASGDTAQVLDVERTEHQQTRDELATATRERDEARRQLAVHLVGQRHQLDQQVISLLVNNSTVTDEASAEKLIADLNLSKLKVLPKAPNNDAGANSRPNGSRTTNQGNGRGAGPRGGQHQQRQERQQPHSNPNNGNGNGNGNNDQQPARRFSWQKEDDVAYPPR